MNPLAVLVGPLFFPESKRATRRGWVILSRAGAGLLLALPLILAAWWWWVRIEIEPEFRSNRVLPMGLGATVVLSIVLSLILSPALLAGTLAGDRERGSIGLLLTTRVDAREIVLGRLFGRLSILFGMLLAGWPFFIGFASLGEIGLFTSLALLALPIAIGFGMGGLSIAASSVARKGWSALMAMYFAELILLLLPSIRLVPGALPVSDLLEPINPFDSISRCLMLASGRPALGTIAVWTLLGSLGATFASWRLRPSFLDAAGGKARGDLRPWKVPPIQETRPMLWKELYIERGAALGWFGRILGTILFVYLVGGSLALVVAAIVFSVGPGSPERLDSLRVLAGRLYSDPGPLFAFLIQMAVGLRAAVTVSSERERNTWDALLTSPLTGREIILGKLWGSLFRLRWLLFAVLLSWVVTLGFGAMDSREFIDLLVMTVVLSTFAAAVGVRASLSFATATRSMSVTVGGILATLAVSSIVMVISTLTIILGFLLVWMVLQPLGLTTSNVRAWVPMNRFGLIWSIQMVLTYLSLTSMLIAQSWQNFDALSGRVTESERGDLPVESRGSPKNGRENGTDLPALVVEVEKVGESRF